MSWSVEEICILLLALYGAVGEPAIRFKLSGPPGADQSAAIEQRGLVLHVEGIPAAFEFTASLGTERPWVLTIDSEPGQTFNARIRRPRGLDAGRLHQFQ